MQERVVINWLHRTLLLEKLTVAQLLKKLPAFYGTRRFIAVFTTACHWLLPSARRIQFTPVPSCFFEIHLISLFHLRLGFSSGLLPLDFPTKIIYAFLFSLMHATCPPIPDLIILITLGEDYKLRSPSLRSSLWAAVTSSVHIQGRSVSQA
jgi:hypothetical protein